MPLRPKLHDLFMTILSTQDFAALHGREMVRVSCDFATSVSYNDVPWHVLVTSQAGYNMLESSIKHTAVPIDNDVEKRFSRPRGSEYVNRPCNILRIDLKYQATV